MQHAEFPAMTASKAKGTLQIELNHEFAQEILTHIAEQRVPLSSTQL